VKKRGGVTQGVIIRYMVEEFCDGNLGQIPWAAAPLGLYTATKTVVGGDLGNVGQGQGENQGVRDFHLRRLRGSLGIGWENERTFS